MFILKSPDLAHEVFAQNWAEAVAEGQSLANTFGARVNIHACGEDSHLFQLFPIRDLQDA